MSDNPFFARGQDVAGDNQPPDQMHYSDWAKLGFRYGWIEYMRGSARIDGAQEHRDHMRAAGYLTGAYAALAPGDPVFQAQTFLSLVQPGDELPDMLDVETDRLTEADVRAWCDFHDANSTRPLVIYTRAGFWASIVSNAAAGRYAKYKLVIAGYPFDQPSKKGDPNDGQIMDDRHIRRRSDPPSLDSMPGIPPPWTLADVVSWQHTGHGSLAGHSRFLDLHVGFITEGQLRPMFSGAAPFSGRTTTDTTDTTTGPGTTPDTGTTPAATPAIPFIAKGTKLGIGQVQNGPALQFVRKAHEAGAPLAGAFGMDNGGVAIDARDLVPFRLTRFVKGDTEAAPGMDDRPSDESLRAMANRQVDDYVHHLNADEKAAATFILPWNEPRPSTVAGYLALTQLMFFTADACEANRFHFLAYAFNAGTPEWDEALAMWRTGINARLIRGGHGISVHMGVLGQTGIPEEISDRMDDRILGSFIKNPITQVQSPTLSNADPLVLRHRFLKAAADNVGVELAPLFGTECYPSTKPIAACDPAELVKRYAWLDGQLAQDAYFRAVFPYAVGSSGVGMPGADHAPIWPDLVKHAIEVKDRVNVGPATAPVGAVRWWEALPSGIFSPNHRLPTPTRLIAMRDFNGDPFPGVFRQNGMEARERQGNLFRVLDEPINDQMWWVMAEDLPQPEG